MHYEIAFSCISHIGKVRKINQDNFICDGHYMEINDNNIEFPLEGYVTSKQPSLFGIYDGMGGEESGEVAAHIAARTSSEIAFSDNGVFDLLEYCKKANAEICDYIEKNPISSMGTTAAMMLFTKKEITLCNVGDSKIFRFSNGEIEQISKDHVVMSAFCKKPPLSQNLGIPPTEMLIEPYVSQGNYKRGDKYLICSDGLTDMVTVDDIKEVVNNEPLNKATGILLNKALENGGRDNTTIILLEIKQKKNKFFKLF